MKPEMAATKRAVHVVISGRVQGVGFRYWTQGQASALGLAGWVRNRPDGGVEAVFSGPGAAVESMLEACRRGPDFAAVQTVKVEDWNDTCFEEFQIRR